MTHLRVARDTGCRSSEMTNMLIKDLVEERMEDGSYVAKIRVTDKTGLRTMRIYYAYPDLKDWLTNGHPFLTCHTLPYFVKQVRRMWVENLRLRQYGKCHTFGDNKEGLKGFIC